MSLTDLGFSLPQAARLLAFVVREFEDGAYKGAADKVAK
jgi:hypothetical protein